MLATHLHTRVSHSILVRLLAIAAFTALTALGARITIDLQPVPITLQVLAVLLAGLTLGARDGAASQVLYAALITAGLPLDAGGLGTLAWLRPSAGYLVGFVLGAFLAGWLAEAGRGRLTLLDWARSWQLGVEPFLVVDAAKSVIAALAAEGARAAIERTRPPAAR